MADSNAVDETGNRDARVARVGALALTVRRRGGHRGACVETAAAGCIRARLRV